VDIGHGGTQAGLLLRREPFEDLGHRGGHELADASELDLTGLGEGDHDGAAVGRIVDSPDESVGDETLDDLAHRGWGRPAEQGDLTGTGRAAAMQDPERLEPAERAGAGLTHGTRPELAHPREEAKELLRDTGVGLRWCF